MYMCEYLKNFIVVGGTGRNVGKTTLVEQLIKKFKDQYTVITVKTSMLLPGEDYLHGQHTLAGPGSFFIREEKEGIGKKDSQRFLKAGAKRSFFISLGDGAAELAMNKLLSGLDEKSLIIMESNVLAYWKKPAVFIMVVDENRHLPKYARLLENADVVVKARDAKAFQYIVNQLNAELDDKGRVRVGK